MINAIINPRLQRLYDYWCERRGERRFPARADLDPLDLAYLMGNLILIDVVDGDPPGFFIRLHGTNLVQRAGYELTGKTLGELPISEFRELATQTFRHVARTGEPFRGYRDRVLDDRSHHYETLILPLSKDGERVDMLLAGLIYADEREPG
ncbi:MAG TPA: PAS domain-containing protein [Stellaceae bacterium]|nr:PAS domain-containing protein [Stellaceae bacterium]